MHNPARTNQSGSMAVYAIIAIVLAAAVISGVYFAQKRGESLRSTAPLAQNGQTSQQSKTEDEAAKRAEEQKKSEQAKQAAEKQKADSEAKKKAEEQATQKRQQEAEVKKRQEAAAAQKKAAEEKAAQQVPATVPQTSTAPPSTERLPQTGPSDHLPEVIAGAVLLAVAFAYLKSYRYRFGSILR